MSNDFLTELRKTLAHETYVTHWFAQRVQLESIPTEPIWTKRLVKSIRLWVENQDSHVSILDRQEKTWFEEAKREEKTADELASYLTELYPEQFDRWAFYRSTPQDAAHRRALLQDWDRARSTRILKERTRLRAQTLPDFQKSLWSKMKSLQDAESAVKSLLTDRDTGWDLDEGTWDHLNFAPLQKAAEMLEKEPALLRIAQLLGRDYRALLRKPESNPPPDLPTEPDAGKTEIRGVQFGSEWGSALSSELSYLAFGQTQVVFFKKWAERELLVWDYFNPVPPMSFEKKNDEVHQKINERGPMIVALDTSGSMRGKPEEVAKTIVYALAKVALEENRPCFLINFSAQTKVLEITDLFRNLPELIAFLEFSFHGGTDLSVALKQAISVLENARYKDADVLVVSDFAVPKIPSAIRASVRRQQETTGTRFYSLTVSVRPQNDFLNIFDWGWVYNIHPYQINGIAPESVAFVPNL